jgi:hypothetical protein
VLKPIRYVYYRVLMWRLKDGRDRTPTVTASIAVSLLLFLNAMLIGEILLTRAGRPWPNIHRDLLTYASVSGALVLLHTAMYFAWVANGRFEGLRQEFDTPSPGRQKTRSILFWSYVILSVTVPYVFAIVIGSTRQS